MRTVYGDIAGALFGKTRLKILALLYGSPGMSYYTRQISRQTQISVGSIQPELENLEKAGIITRKVEGKQVYYKANPECPIFDELKSLVRKTTGMADVIRSALSPLENRIEVAFIYGSMAKMSERSGSDVDLMVIGDISFGDTVDLLAEAQRIIAREINPTVYPADEFRSRMSAGNDFLRRLIEAPKIFLIGNEDELARLAK